MEGQKKHVSDVIDIEKDILPYRIVQVFSGVGSGKNYWANSLADKYRVLYITSRKATANAEADRIGAKRWIDLEELSEKSWGEIKNNPVICTNSGIMQFLKTRYDESNKDTHIWNFFDFIVLDEAHSLTADAVFSDAPFYVERFIKYSVQKNPKLHLIIMTGTPNPIDWLIPQKYDGHPSINTLDFLSTCVSVSPKTIHFIPAKKAEQKLKTLLIGGDKVVYFVSSIGNMKNIINNKITGLIANEKIGVAFAKKEREGDFDSEFIIHQKNEVAAYLRENDMLPEHIQLFLTTTQNKEGVNIKNDDIHVMFVESDSADEIIQMAGRIRNGLDTLYVIADKALPQNAEGTMLGINLDTVFLENVNSGYDSFIIAHPSKSDDAIKELERRFPHIRYDPLHDKRFIIYEGKVHGEKRRISDHNDIKRWIEEYSKLSDLSAGSSSTVKSMLEKQFPDSAIDVDNSSKTEKESWTEAALDITELLDTKNWLGNVLPDSDQEAILNAANKIFDKHGLKHDYKNLGAALNRVGYKKETVGTKKTGKGHFKITADNGGEN